QLYLHHSPVLFYNATATSDIYTLSLHDALPICNIDYCQKMERRNRQRMRSTKKMIATSAAAVLIVSTAPATTDGFLNNLTNSPTDRKSTRLNSSHVSISYAVFCLKKKNIKKTQ